MEPTLNKNPFALDVKVFPMYDDVVLPSYGSHGAIGLDLRAYIKRCDPTDRTLTLFPGRRASIPTGLKIAFPTGRYARIAPRSGLAVKSGIDVLAGVVDSDYRGEIMVALINLSDTPVKFTHGDKIAQMIFEMADRAEIEAVPNEADLGITERGEGGFGSTGQW